MIYSIKRMQCPSTCPQKLNFLLDLVWSWTHNDFVCILRRLCVTRSSLLQHLFLQQAGKIHDKQNHTIWVHKTERIKERKRGKMRHNLITLIPGSNDYPYILYIVALYHLHVCRTSLYMTLWLPMAFWTLFH